MGAMPILEVSPSSLNFLASGETKFFIIKTNYNIIGDVGTIPAWITLDPTILNIPPGDTNVSITVSENLTSSSRNNIIQFENEIGVGYIELNITQEAGEEPTPNYSSNISVMTDEILEIGDYLQGWIYIKDASNNNTLDSFYVNGSGGIGSISNLEVQYYLDVTNVVFYDGGLAVATDRSWEELYSAESGVGGITNSYESNTNFEINISITP